MNDNFVFKNTNKEVLYVGDWGLWRWDILPLSYISKYRDASHLLSLSNFSSSNTLAANIILLPKHSARWSLPWSLNCVWGGGGWGMKLDSLVSEAFNLFIRRLIWTHLPVVQSNSSNSSHSYSRQDFEGSVELELIASKLLSSVNKKEIALYLSFGTRFNLVSPKIWSLNACHFYVVGLTVKARSVFQW